MLKINPLTATIEDIYAVLGCEPAGLALNPTNNTLLLGCSTTFDTAGDPWSGTDANTAMPLQQIFGTNGLLQAVVPGPGSSDEVWYNAGDDHFYTGSSSSPFAPSVIVPGATAVSQGAEILGVIDGSSRPYSNENSRRNGISTAMTARLHEIARPPQGLGAVA